MDICRLKQVALYTALILATGVLYGAFVTATGIGLPCMFRQITGLQCPGCGVTHMCTALMHLDFHHAFLAHPVILSLLPLWLCCLVKNIILYIRTGSYQLSRIERILLYTSIVLLLLYGIVRNFSVF